MRSHIVVAVAAVLFSLFSTASAQTQVVISSPTAKITEAEHDEADERLVRDKLVPKAAARWSELDYCDGSNLNIVGTAQGSFTKAGTAQRVLVYELCQTGNGFGNNGIAVFEGDRVVAHFVVEGGWNLEVTRVPDINRNGRDEIAIETSGGMHQGYMGTSVTVLEMTDTDVNALGSFVVYTNECETPVASKYCDRSYRLTAAPGPKPVFYTQKYVNRGTDETPRWIASGKPVAARSVGDLRTKYELLK